MEDLGKRKFIGGSGAYKALNSSGGNPYRGWGKSYAAALQKEQDAQDTARKKQEAQKNLDQAKKEGFNPVNSVLGFLGDAGKNIGSGIQQGLGSAADVAIEGGATLNELGNQLFSPNSQKDKRTVQIAKNAEALRSKLHGQKDISGNNISGVSSADNITARELNNPQNVAKVAGAALDASLGATQFINPTGLLRQEATRGIAQNAVKTGLSLSKTAKPLSNGRRIAAEAALFGTTGGVQQGLSTYGQTGDVNKALQEGGKAALLGAAQQGILSGAGVLTGKAINKVKTRGQVSPPSDLAGVDSSAQALSKDLGSKPADQKALPAITDTTKGELGNRLNQIDAAINQANSGDINYLRDNNLLNTQAGDKRLKELTTQDPQAVAKQKEAAKAVVDAQTQVDYYNKIKSDSAYFRQTDNIEAQRGNELENLNKISQDPQIQADPNAIRSMADEINAKYDQQQQALAQKYPEDAMQKPALDNAIQQATNAKLDAQDNLNQVTQDIHNAAFKEANAIAETPNPEAIKQHINDLNAERANIEDRIAKAQTRADNTNQNINHIDQEIASLQDGSHPLRTSGASSAQVKARFAELQGNKRALEDSQLMAADPKVFDNPIDKQIRKEAVSEHVADQIEIPNNKKSLFLDLVELPDEYLRYRGLGKLADKYDDSVIAFNKAMFGDEKSIKSWVKQAKGNKSKTLFDAADGDKAAYDRLTPGGKEVIDSYRRTMKDWGRQLGLPEEILNKDYVPHLMGDDAIRNKVLGDVQELKDLRSKMDTMSTEERAKAHKREAVLNKRIEDATSIENYHKVSGKINDKFLNKRYGAGGYERDFWKAVQAYSSAKNTKLHMEGVATDMARIANTSADPRLKTWLDKQISTVRGGKAASDKAIDDFFNEQFGIKNLGTRTAVQSRRLSSMAKIGFSLNSIVNSSMQLGTIPGVIGPDGATVGFAKAGKMLAELGSGAASKDTIEKWNQMHRIGLFEGDSQLVPDSAVQGVGKILDKTAFAGIKGADRYMRVVTYLGAEHKGRQKGLEGKELERYAWRMTNKANQNFSKFVAPQAFRSQVAKTMWSMMTFLPGTVVRSAEVDLKGLKGLKDAVQIGHSKLTGKPVTAGEFRNAIDAVSKAVFMNAALAGMSAVIGSVTGSGEVVPNPFNQDSWSTPATQFIFGSDTQAGLLGLLPSGSDKLTRNPDGSVTNEDYQKRVKQFFTQTLPSYTVPGYAQAHRTIQGLDENAKGYGVSANGNIQYNNDSSNNVQRALFGKYSTPEGQQYVKGLSTPEGGPVSSKQTESILSQPKGLRQQYFDFYKAADQVTGRQAANDAVNQAYKDGNVQRARNKAAEYNAKVDKTLASFYAKYKNIDPDLIDKLNKNLYITITPRGEKRRMNQ